MIVCAAVTFTILLVSANTVAMSVRERVREVGILKTLGFTPRAILLMILGEAGVISLLGGVIGIAVAFGHGYLRTAVRNLWMLLMHWRVSGVRPLPEVTLEGTGGPRLAYAFPIAIGTVITLCLK